MAGLIVHEWLEEQGGAEMVVESMLDAFPDSDLYCLWNDAAKRFGAETSITESWMARTFLRRHKALALPLMPLVWQNVRARKQPDWVLSSSNAFAHQVRVRNAPPGRKYVYVHSPARYIWEPSLDSRSRSFLASPAMPVLRRIDRRLVDRNAEFASNSEFVRSRVSRAWGIDSRVIYPPVSVSEIESGGSWRQRLDAADSARMDTLPAEFILAFSRWVPYKRIDSAIRLAARLDYPIVVAGGGPDGGRLRSIASDCGARVIFIDRPSTALARALYQECLCLAFLGIEDFGIVPVEAMAAGARVMVNRTGGTAESVIDGISGVHTDPDDYSEMEHAFYRLASLDVSNQARSRARTFRSNRFVREIREWVDPERAEGGR